MRKLLTIAVIAGAAVAATIPSTASAWTHCGTPQAESDCPPIHACVDGVLTEVPDNGQYTPAEECAPPPKTITVCLNGEEITVPENEMPAGATEGECAPVVPPPNQPEAPVPGPTPPTPDTPDTDTIPPPVEDTPPEGEGHVGTPGLVKGKEQSTPENLPIEEERVAADTDTLPYTGLGLGFVALLGAVLLAVGLIGRRRTA